MDGVHPSENFAAARRCFEADLRRTRMSVSVNAFFSLCVPLCFLQSRSLFWPPSRKWEEENSATRRRHRGKGGKRQKSPSPPYNAPYTPIRHPQGGLVSLLLPRPFFGGFRSQITRSPSICRRPMYALISQLTLFCNMQLNVLDDLAEAMKALDGKKNKTHQRPDPFVS